MRLIQNAVHKDFQPLNIAASVLVLEPDKAVLIQVFDAILNEYVPDHADGAPLTLLPYFELMANDGSMDKPLTNADLVFNVSGYESTWYVNGKPIADVYKSTEYSIEQTGVDDAQLGVNTRGMLTLSKNYERGEEAQLHFEGYVRDPRTGRYHHIVSDPQTVGCLEKAQSQYRLVIEGAPYFAYNPVNDDKLENAYYKANNIDETAPDNAGDDVSYEHTWTYSLRQGGVVYGTGKYSVKAFDKDTGDEITEDATDGILELSNTSFTVDTRLVLDRAFELVAYIYSQSEDKDIEVDRQLVSYRTKYPFVEGVPVNQCDYLPTDKKRANRIIVSAMSRCANTGSPQMKRVPYPDRLMDFTWKAVNSLGVSKELGTGSKILYNIADANIGDDEVGDTSKSIPTCDYGETCDAEWLGAMSLATDGDGAYLSDGESILALY